MLGLAGELHRQGLKPVVVLTECPPQSAKSCQELYREIPILTENRPEVILNIARRRQVNIVHVHSLALLPLALPLAGRLNAPFGITLYESNFPKTSTEMIKKASFVIKTRQNPGPETAVNHNNTVFIPEGVDLTGFKPEKKEGFSVTFITDSGYHGDNSCLALLKAAGLGNFFVNIAGSEYYPTVNGKYHQWQPHYDTLLSSSHVVVGRERALLEGMACGNAALIMGKSYHGILQPQNFSAAGLPDLSGGGTIEPCYRNIFNDLAELWKDRDYLETLQYRGRKYVRENHDLRLTAEATVRLYQKTLQK